MHARTYIIWSVCLCLLLSAAAISDDSRNAEPAKPAQYLRADSAFFKINSWESTGKAEGKYFNINDLDFHPNGQLFLVHAGLDPLARVEIFDTNGKFLYGFGGFQNGVQNPEATVAPSGIALSPDGTILVSESLPNDIKVFSKERKYVSDIHLPSRFYSRPSCVAVDRDGNIYTADEYNTFLYKYSPKGKLIWENELSESGFAGSSPQEIAISPDGTRVYLADAKENGVRVFDAETGKDLNSITGADAMISYPLNLDCRSDGSIVVVDPNEKEVLIHLLSKDGSRLSVTKFPHPGDGYSFKVAANFDGTIAVTACDGEPANGKITFYRNALYKPADGTAKIKGKVKGISSDAIANLTVRIDGTQDGVPFYATVRPSSKGKFVFTRFPDGIDYTVSLLGYDTTKYNCEPVEGTAGGTQKIKLLVKK